MQAHGFCSPSPDDCYVAADSSDPSHHDCLDDRGGMCLSFRGMDSTQPRAARLRRRQRNRTPVGWSSVVALSSTFQTAACREISHPNRRSAAICGCRVRRSSVGGIATGISRAPTHPVGSGSSGSCCCDHAVARSTEAPVVRGDQQRCPKGRFCRIRTVRLSFLDRIGGHRSKHDLAHCLG